MENLIAKSDDIEDQRPKVPEELDRWKLNKKIAPLPTSRMELMTSPITQHTRPGPFKAKFPSPQETDSTRTEPTDSPESRLSNLTKFNLNLIGATQTTNLGLITV
jgi:hypothetical protein